MTVTFVSACFFASCAFALALGSGVASAAAMASRFSENSSALSPASTIKMIPMRPSRIKAPDSTRLVGTSYPGRGRLGEASSPGTNASSRSMPARCSVGIRTTVSRRLAGKGWLPWVFELNDRFINEYVLNGPSFRRRNAKENSFVTTRWREVISRSNRVVKSCCWPKETLHPQALVFPVVGV